MMKSSTIIRANMERICHTREIYGESQCNHMVKDITIPEIKRFADTLDLARKLLKEKGSLKVLDVGCNAGYMTHSFHEVGCQVSALDKYPPEGKYGLRFFSVCRSLDIDYKLGDIVMDWPFDAESFDFIYMGAIIEHLSTGHKKALQNAYRVLKPGGTLVIDTPNLGYFWCRLGLLRGKSIGWPLDDLFNNDCFVGHYREFTVNELSQMLEWSGFKIDEIKMTNPKLLPRLHGCSLAGGLKLAVGCMTANIAGLFPSLRYLTWIAGTKI